VSEEQSLVERQLSLSRGLARPRRAAFPRGAALGLVVPLALLALWQLVTTLGVFERSQLPGPLDVLAAARELIARGELASHLLVSLRRVLLGFAIGGGLAVILGGAIGLSRQVETLLGPTFQALRAIPSLAWVPLLVLWLGVGEAPKLTLVAIGAFFPVLSSLVAGIRQIDRKLVEVAVAYGLSGVALARQVLLPAALPALLTGLRIGLAQSWLFLVAAELIGASRGLGFLLVDGQNSGRADIIVLSIVLLALIGKGTDALLHQVERRALRWADSYKG
jgi:sulfonate transport system permease protein